MSIAWHVYYYITSISLFSRARAEVSVEIFKINGTMGSRDCFSKVLPNIKLATRFDADGKEVQVNKQTNKKKTPANCLRFIQNKWLEK